MEKDIVDGSNPNSTTPLELGWYILGENQECLGPYAIAELQEYFASGYFTESTLFWAEGRSDWLPLYAIQELYALVAAKKELHQNHNTLAPIQSNNQTQVNGQTTVPDSLKASGDGEDDDFRRWQEEVRKAEAEAEALKSGTRESANVDAQNLDMHAQGEIKTRPQTSSGDERPCSPPDGEEEFTDDDGTVYRWDHNLHAWVPQEDSFDKYSLYGTEEMTFVNDEEVMPVLRVADSLDEKECSVVSKATESKAGTKRKLHNDDKTQKKEADRPPEAWFDLKVNTHVYVTGLPEDVTVEEIVEAFSKCGIIKEDPDTKKLRVKIYVDKETGIQKGVARHGMQSPLSMQKASPRLKGKQPIGSPDPRSAGKKRGEEDFRNRTPTPNPAASENCDPNFSDGAVTTKNLEPPMFAVASGIHSCKSRRCASNNPDWMTTGVRVQPRKFLVAKRYLQQQQEPSICKCCDKKISADASVRKKCVCGAPKQLRVSQEDFVKENLEGLDCAGERTTESLMCRESDFQAPENAYVHILKNEQGEIQSGEEGANGFCENADDGIHRNIRRTEEEGADGFSGIGDGHVHEKIQSAKASANGFSEIADDGVNERTQGPEAGTNGFYEIADEGVDEKPRNPGVGTVGFSEIGDGEIHAKIQCAKQSNSGFACQVREQIQCYEEGALGFDGSESNPTVSAAAVPLPETGWISSSQKMSAVPRRLRNELLEEAINTIPQQGGGRVKHLVKAFESLMSLPDSEIVEAEGYRARPLDKSIYNVSQVDQDKHRLAVGRGLKWALPGMQPQVSGESSSSPSGETYAHFKFRISEDAASVGHSESQSVDSFGRSECSFGSRRRSKKDSLDSSGRGSLGKNGTHPWKKQLKVTGAQPFKLRTEQRGHMKEREFMKKVQEMIAEEEKHRIPIAQGLPWTTDEPERLLKPPVKENTKPLDIKLYTEARAVDRAEFDHTISEKLSFLEQQRLEEERLQKLAEEEEIKRLRRELIPRAQPMPFFDRPFIPKRSSKNPTIPKEPKFHVPHHKRAKSISWNDFNVCQQ